jgi:hypothetical protein
MLVESKQLQCMMYHLFLGSHLLVQSPQPFCPPISSSSLPLSLMFCSWPRPRCALDNNTDLLICESTYLTLTSTTSFSTPSELDSAKCSHIEGPVRPWATIKKFPSLSTSRWSASHSFDLSMHSLALVWRLVLFSVFNVLI